MSTPPVKVVIIRRGQAGKRSRGIPPVSSRTFPPHLEQTGQTTARVLARCSRYSYPMIQMRLTSSVFWVDVRVLEINGRWIASADTPDGPSLGVGELAVEAIEGALQPFEGIIDEQLASIPGGSVY